MTTSRKFIPVPADDWHLKRMTYIEPEPVPEYAFASAEAIERFRDIKYMLRIHWGLYSVWELNHESWGLLDMDFAKKQDYFDLSKTFNPTEFDAEAWVQFFERAGFRGFAFTSKHHEGFSMFDTQTRVKQKVDWRNPGGPKIVACDEAFSVIESPFGRDIVKELCDAGQRRNLAIDLYFSWPDWFDADFRPYSLHPVRTPEDETCEQDAGMRERFDLSNWIVGPSKTDQERQRLIRRVRNQLRELLTHYGKIDMICLDHWLGPDVWPQQRKILLELRRLQPDVMFRNRGIGNYGDYYTPEHDFPEKGTEKPWMVIHGLAGSFSYDKNAQNYRDEHWVLDNLLDTVAKGGNFQIGIGPNGKGQWHPRAVDVLTKVGGWLHENGEGIYGTRPRPGELYREGGVLFTRTKDQQHVYAFVKHIPVGELVLESLSPAPDADITLLGTTGMALAWKIRDGKLHISIPEAVCNRCNHAHFKWTALKIEVQS